MSQMQELLERANKVLIGNYARQPVVMVRGQGAWVWDADGKRYLDLFAGFGGTILGHCHPALVEAAGRQAQQLWHVGNVYHSEPQIRVAEWLNRTAFPGRAFFCHSGAEANEAACKLARLRGNTAAPGRNRIIALNQCFHGRTMAMLAATGNPKYLKGFEPVIEGFTHVPGGDFDALKAAVDERTAGVIMEPVQGEGGMNVYPPDYAAKVRQLCDERQITLIFDEVWTGGGRMGRWYGHQYFRTPDGRPVTPDIMTLGKAVGGGLPVGVMFARPEIASLLVPGTHGCTLGGNPICMAVSAAIFETVERDNLLAHAAELGEWAIGRLRNEPRLAGKVVEVRGHGLFLGIELAAPPERFVERGLERGVMLNVTSGKVVRLAPPLTISRADFQQGVETVIELIAG